MNIYKGYIRTKNKEAIESIKGRKKFNALEDVKDAPEYAGMLAPGIVLIDLDDGEESDVLMDILKDKGVHTRIYKTTRGKHFIFKNGGLKKNGNHLKSAINLTMDVKLGDKNSYEVIKVGGKDREILFDSTNDSGEYDVLPRWLIPVKTSMDFNNLKDGDGRNDAFFKYILTLQSAGLGVEEIRETIHIINDYVLFDPLPESELKTILRDEAFSKPDFGAGRNLHIEVVAEYLKNNNHIVRINGRLHMYGDGIYTSNYADIEHEMIEIIPGITMSKRREILAYLDVMIRENTPSADARWIAFKNGLYNLDTDQFVDFEPGIIITNRIECDYNPAANSDLANHVLDKLSCHDADIRALLEECIGYCFYRRNELRKAFILTGDKANGKSTYLDMVKTLLGDVNTSALDLKELGDRFKTAELFGKLANIGDDIGDEFIANAAIFKKLVSGDRVNTELKGQNPFEFNNYAKMLFSANTIPRIKDQSGAVLDRLIIVPFNATFSKDDADFDPYIKYKLREPAVLEYLAKIGIEGLKRVMVNQRFTVSDKSKAELKTYHLDNNPIELWFQETDIMDILHNSNKAVYRGYSTFCAGANLKPLSAVAFSRLVNKHFGLKIVDKKIDGKKCRVYMMEGEE